MQQVYEGHKCTVQASTHLRTSVPKNWMFGSSRRSQFLFFLDSLCMRKHVVYLLGKTDTAAMPESGPVVQGLGSLNLLGADPRPLFLRRLCLQMSKKLSLHSPCRVFKLLFL